MKWKKTRKLVTKGEEKEDRGMLSSKVNLEEKKDTLKYRNIIMQTRITIYEKYQERITNDK